VIIKIPVSNRGAALNGNAARIDEMSASSGASKFCSVCKHANNEHNYYTYEASKCRKKFKVCQRGSHDGIASGAYVLCKACPDHPYECSNIDAYKIKRL